jgi:hypothetical protein
MNPIFDLVRGLISPITNYVTNRQTIKADVQKRKDRVAEAKVTGMEKRLAEGLTGDIAWEQTSIENAGWMNDWILVLFSIPIAMCFAGPGGAAWVTAGFLALSQTPVWFQSAWGVMVASAFGYKKFANLMTLRKGD